jgi:lipoyl(octanoyl) transferase
MEGRVDEDTVEWLLSDGPVDYAGAVAFMERRVGAIRAGQASEAVWLLEHPPLYTAGSSAHPDELLDAGRLPGHRPGRGGRYTYHGPGQRVAYVMLDLSRRGNDLRAHVGALEAWLIAALARFAVIGERRADRIGIWVRRPGAGGAPADEAKIGAIGVRVRRWVSYHGVALNVAPDLEHFAGIVPCGIEGFGVTSLADLGVVASMKQVDAALRDTFAAAFGRVPGPTRGFTDDLG